MDLVLGTLLWVFLHKQRSEQVDPEIKANLHHSVIYIVFVIKALKKQLVLAKMCLINDP